MTQLRIWNCSNIISYPCWWKWERERERAMRGCCTQGKGSCRFQGSSVTSTRSWARNLFVYTTSSEQSYSKCLSFPFDSEIMQLSSESGSSPFLAVTFHKRLIDRVHHCTIIFKNHSEIILSWRCSNAVQRHCSIPQVLCPILGLPLQERHGGAGACLEKGNEAGEVYRK